jgi:hypothetical protein
MMNAQIERIVNGLHVSERRRYCEMARARAYDRAAARALQKAIQRKIECEARLRKLKMPLEGEPVS